MVDPIEVDESCRVKCSSIGDINLLTFRANNALATGKIPTIAASNSSRTNQIPPEYIRRLIRNKVYTCLFNFDLKGISECQYVNNERPLKEHEKNALIFLPALLTCLCLKRSEK